jgi:hypothetical protein
MVEKLIKTLRGFGTFGGWAANVLQFLSSIFPGLTMSAAGAAAALYFESAIELIQQPIVYVPASVFLFLLWTYIGLATLTARQRPQIVRMVHDYAYGLILEGHPTIVMGKFPNDHAAFPGGFALMLNCNYRNVSHGPIRLRVEEFRVVLNNRTNDNSDASVELFFARLAAMGIRSGGVPIDTDAKQLDGTLTLKFVYGHPDGDFDRRYTLKLNIHIMVNLENGMATYNDDGIQLTDKSCAPA